MSTSLDRSLLTIIIDVSPTTWGERELRRNQSDRARASKGKRSIGPAKLDDVLSSVLAFCLAYSSLHRENCIVLIAVAGDHAAVVYPRKAGEGSMYNAVHDPPELGCKVDSRRLHDGLKLGVAELVTRSAAAVSKAASASKSNANKEESSSASSSSSTTVKKSSWNDSAIASALSLALCTTNRFMVATGGGVSALANESLLKRGEDNGVLSILGGGGGSGNKKAAEERDERRRARGMLGPRVLIIQASVDRTRDYNAFMNCVFASIKADVTIDGCFIPSGIQGQAKSSAFLEQACDRTGGVFLAPSGAAQVGGAFTEVLVSVFLPPISARRRLNLPALTKVDFRARCFETGESVDIANVCNQCLSMFKNKPKDQCPTCGAGVIKAAASKGDDERSPKRIKRN